MIYFKKLGVKKEGGVLGGEEHNIELKTTISHRALACLNAERVIDANTQFNLRAYSSFPLPSC